MNCLQTYKFHEQLTDESNGNFPFALPYKKLLKNAIRIRLYIKDYLFCNKTTQKGEMLINCTVL